MWTINGVDPNTYGLKVSEVPGWETAPALDYLTQAVPGKAGSTLLRSTPQIGPRRLQVSGNIVGTSNADMLTKFDQLKSLFSAPSLVVVMNNRNTRQLVCRLDGVFDIPSVDASMLTRKIPVSFALVADDPWWYDIATTTVAAIIATGNGTAIPVGTAPVWPVLNGNTGTPGTYTYTTDLFADGGTPMGTLSITGTFLNGDLLVIDMLNKVVKLNGVVRMDLISGGDFFMVDIARMGNYLTSSWPTIRRGTNFATDVVYKKAWR